MRPAHIKSYAPAFTLGEPLTNYGVSEVLKSENPKFPVGAKVYSAYHKFSEYQIFPEDKVKELTVLENKEKLPLTVSSRLFVRKAWC
jgi:NADPH-dependent curcumin reductase CurA